VSSIKSLDKEEKQMDDEGKKYIERNVRAWARRHAYHFDEHLLNRYLRKWLDQVHDIIVQAVQDEIAKLEK